MGMGEKKVRAKAFKQRTAKVVAEDLEQPGLFSNKSVETEHAYECLREPEDAPVKEGARVKLVDMRDRIDVYIGVTCVGVVVSSHAEELRQRYKLAEHSNRSISGKVVDVSDISAAFFVVVGK